MGTRWLIGGVAAALLTGVAAVPLALTPASAAAAANAGCVLTDDLVVGAPAEDIGAVADAGAVTIVYGGPDGRFGGAGGLLLTQESVGQVSERGDRFGAAVALADIIGDGCTDLIIGAPGEDARTGQVVIVPGSSTGPRGADAVVVRQGERGVAGAAEVGDAFGSTLGLRHEEEDVLRLWIGAPFEDVGGAADAGAVTRIALTPDLDHVESFEYAQGVLGVPGTPEAGDHFGAALSVAQETLIGVPGEDVGGITDAGLVAVIREGDAPGPAQHSREFSQASSGIPGKAEAGDRFGSSVAADAGDHCEDTELGTAIGSPGEDLGAVKDAGTVTFLFGDYRGRVTILTDRSVERGDRFGTALFAVGTGLMIGAPGEDVGSVQNAGAVTWQAVDCGELGESLGLGPRRVYTQRTAGVPGVAEPGDGFGASLGCVCARVDSFDSRAAFVVGAPGETVGAAVRAGAVTVLPAGFGNPTAQGTRTYSQSSTGFPGASEAGDRFGASLPVLTTLTR